ncbi:MAG: PhoH-like protein [Lentisphaerae bacterium ADurb.BinA184]|nr:MAG: PhoH-like protein [Lentisphaerae bacterium ADurb.BinA184]
MAKTLILDTSVLLHNPQAIMSFPGARLLIPIEVVEELDEFKREMSERGRNSRTFAQLLDNLRKKGRLSEGVEVGGGASVRIACEPSGSDMRAYGLTANGRVDNRILSMALDLRKRSPDEEAVVVTKNVNLRLKADALDIPAEDYEIDRSPDADVYTGWQGVAAPAGKIVPLVDQTEGAAGILPLNLEQMFALDALLDDKVTLVTLTGKAGTGKTLLAVAAGLRKVFKEDLYNRLLIFRPTTPLGRDIGFLPGDVGEKMKPWMQPVYDALELIREQDKRSRFRALPPDILECEEISIEPLTYIRGRSIPHQFIVIDEAQNLTPLELKTVVTRVGRGTKIVLTGDPHQIDNPYVDALSNGLVFLLDRFRHSTLSAHVGLVKGERSELAETAANLL